MEEDYKTMESNIELAYGKDRSRFTKLIINPDLETLNESLDFFYLRVPQNSLYKKEIRDCFQFVTDNSQSPAPPPGQTDPMLDSIPFDEVIKRTAACGIHIVDCDFAGSLMPKYNQMLTELDERGYNVNFFAFFSCRADERNPRSPGLPSDLFSSCLNSPGKMALLWHSSHYYCFKNGPLKPIHIDDLSQASPELIQTVDSILRGYIEAMACQYMSHYDFINLFHCDDFVVRCVCGFVMAQKIFDFFSVQPLSIPPIPDFKDNPIWQNFSLQLDEALAKFREPQQTFQLTKFLEYDITTVNLLLECDTEIEYYLPFLSVLHHILNDPDLAKSGLKFLCRFLDKSMKANEEAWLFPLIDPLNKMLFDGSDDPYLLLAIAKSMVYAPQCRKNFYSTIDTVFIKKRLLPLCCEKKTSLVATVLFAINFHLFPGIDDKDYFHGVVTKLIRTPWKDCIDNIMETSVDAAAWALMFISSIVPDIDNQNFYRIYLIVVKRLNHQSPVVRAAALNAIAPFSHRTSDNRVFEAIHKLIHDISPVVRSQLVCSLSTLYQIAQTQGKHEILSLVIDDMKILANDPFINIAYQASMFLENQSVIPSCIFEHLAMQFLGPATDIIDRPEETLESLHLKPVRIGIDSDIRHRQFKRSGTIEQTVSSNLCIAYDNSLLFGNSNGNIGVVHLTTSQKVTWCKLAAKEITYITAPLQNVVLASDVLGNIYSIRYMVSTGTLNLITTFNAMSNLPRIDQMGCSSVSRILALLSKSVPSIPLIDLASEKRTGVLKPVDGQPVFVDVLDNFRDLAVVCANDVEFFDVRSSFDKPIYTISNQQTPFSCQFAGVQNSITIAYNNCSVAYGDWRQSPETFQLIQSSQVINDSSSSIQKLATHSYAAHPNCMMCAVGSNRGLSLLSFENDNHFYHSTVTTSLFSAERIHPVTQVVLHPTRLFAAALVEKQDIITFAEV
jgi:regulator-associated protein of mTOR